MEVQYQSFITEKMTNLVDVEPWESNISVGIEDAFETMNQFRKDNLLCDVILKCRDKSFPCHRIVLASRIPYFEVMFSSRMMEITQKEIEIKDFDPTILESFVSYAYDGLITITCSNAYVMLAFSLYWNLEDISNTCLDYITEILLCSDNVFDIKEFAVMLNCIKLTESCIEYVEKYFEEISNLENFLQIPIDGLMEIIKRDMLPEREELIYEAIMRWIYYDPDRHAYLAELLGELRLTLMEHDYLKNKVLTDHLISSNEACRSLVLEAMRYRSMSFAHQMTFETNQNMTPRAQNNGSIYVVGGIMTDDDLDSYVKITEIYDPYKDEHYENESKMSSRKYKFGIAALHGKLYAVGGKQRYRENIAECYDPHTDVWSTIASPQTTRLDVGVCALNDNIYACGGCSRKNQIYQCCERYSPACDKWESIDSMKETRCSGGVVSLYGCVWAIGGEDNRYYLNTVERYDPREPYWHSEENMNVKRSSFGCAALYGKIYAMGGFSHSDSGYQGEVYSVEIYDPRNKKWQFGTPMERKICYLSSVENKGKLYTMGVESNVKTGVFTNVYDPVKNIWKSVSTMQYRRVYFSAAVLPNVKK